ncbi:hypothetical protein D7X32_00275 [Corallococcus carmarthensis]|uniref:Apolipoprotein N-acyltransferase n=1 Tax=Corallococcus carmarthensis TaxID=2316728 RepID=A0A3A8KK38_9BACT|nr:hypothetical protein D7X32_00275 [Corallococcus carmarthensis]
MIWPFGLPHFFPLLGVYMLMFNKQFPQGMALGFAVTGLFLGLVQCFWRGFKALLVTPVFFVLAYAPIPLALTLVESRMSFGSLAIFAVPWSCGVILLGQWVLDRWWAGPAPTTPPRRRYNTARF